MKTVSLKMTQIGDGKVWVNYILFWELTWLWWVKTMGCRLPFRRSPKFWSSFIKCQGSPMQRISQSCQVEKASRISWTQSLTVCAIAPICPCTLFQEPGYNIWARASLSSGSGTPSLRLWSQQFTSETSALISSKTTNTPLTSPSYSKNQFHTKSSWSRNALSLFKNILTCVWSVLTTIRELSRLNSMVNSSLLS